MTVWVGSRRRLLQYAAAAVAAAAPAASAARRRPLLSGLLLDDGGHPFAGDTPLLTTVSPRPERRVARLRFVLARPARVSLDVLKTRQGISSEQPISSGSSQLGTRSVRLGAGEHALHWRPDPTLPARTYVLEVKATPAEGPPALARGVARLLGVDAGFLVRSAQPGDRAELVVRTDASWLTVRVIRSGPEQEPTYANDLLNGVQVTEPATIDWRRHANAPSAIGVEIGDWPSGVYAVRLDADDGRLGFAPLIVRPAQPQHRIAVVMPTSTWQAYNFYDADGDGWGDTWYARWRTRTVDLTRPMARRGVPYRYRSYDLDFQHWLAQTRKQVDVYADEDLERFASPDALRSAYDLLVFPGHTEYVTTRIYDLVLGYRDLGGNLLFLSANNFFRRVDRAGNTLTLIDEWRNLHRPEAALLGVQYIANDRGERQEPFTVTGAALAPWAFAGTGLANGSTFGRYGIEIDARGPASPPQTQVLATIPDLFGPGRSAEMSYYEHESGARVFAAGALNFGGQVMLWPETRQLLENVWQRLAGPAPQTSPPR